MTCSGQCGRLYLNFILWLLMISISLALGACVVDTASAVLSKDREQIKISAAKDDPDINNLSRQELIFSTENVTGLQVKTMNLQDDKDASKSINASRMRVTPDVFDITRADHGNIMLNIVVDASGAAPGVYTGTIYIIDVPHTPLTIPITVTIRDPIWYGLALVAVGVTLNFLTKVFKPEPKPGSGIYAGKTEYVFDWTVFKQNVNSRGGWSQLVVGVLVFFAVLAAWQAYYPNLETFGRSPMDYLAALSAGFAAQAVIGEAVEIVRKLRQP